MPRHITEKLQNNKDKKKKILKGARGKRQLTSMKDKDSHNKSQKAMEQYFQRAEKLTANSVELYTL